MTRRYDDWTVFVNFVVIDYKILKRILDAKTDLILQMDNTTLGTFFLRLGIKLSPFTTRGTYAWQTALKEPLTQTLPND